MDTKSSAKARLLHCKKAHAKIDILLGSGEVRYVNFSDEDMSELRKQGQLLLQYIHELNAYRNVDLNTIKEGK